MKHLTLLILLAGCSVVPEHAVPPPAEDTCNASAHADLIGQDAKALERRLILGPVRLVRPGDMVTMDFRPERINFEIGQDEIIASIRCG
ncbi:I78 family peptidase inhibitor [Loktanella agnita]|uniref:I78 family peptidase inhibitor n=1 Tax=Loktanella agnita TaxID=287097 RepID=UPI003986730E